MRRRKGAVRKSIGHIIVPGAFAMKARRMLTPSREVAPRRALAAIEKPSSATRRYLVKTWTDASVARLAADERAQAGS
jgi:hypothetical protein